MTISEILAAAYGQSFDILLAGVADFSAEEMFVRPCPGANHATWQIGHLIKSQAGMLSIAKPDAAAISTDFASKFVGTAAAIDDPAAFLPKDELLRAYERLHTTCLEWMKSLTNEELARGGPGFQDWAPTVGSLAILMSSHITMHLGQIQVIRRKLGKARLM